MFVGLLSATQYSPATGIDLLDSELKQQFNYEHSVKKHQEFKLHTRRLLSMTTSPEPFRWLTPGHLEGRY